MIEGVPQSQFRRDPAAEELADVHPVGTFRGSGQPQQFPRRHMVEQPTVGLGLRVVEFVDDHHVEVIRRNAVQPGLRQRLDAGEDVTPLPRLLPVDQ